VKYIRQSLNPLTCIS